VLAPIISFNLDTESSLMEADSYIYHLFSELAAHWIGVMAAFIIGVVVGWLSCSASLRQLTRR
jgi:hypothetical protein